MLLHIPVSPGQTAPAQGGSALEPLFHRKRPPSDEALLLSTAENNDATRAESVLLQVEPTSQGLSECVTTQNEENTEILTTDILDMTSGLPSSPPNH